MQTISLINYEKEIEQLIEKKEYDESIAHCFHILEEHPKHLNTLRLLGKAFLEKKQYPEAEQSFLRVLAAIPTDFIAHIGLSVIREDQQHLDAAIWHMERAFEQQPVNSAIQDELRRLYSIRNPEKPAVLALSNAALLRMYIRGKLIPQAIAEAEAALKEKPGRLDIQTVLAWLYHSENLPDKSLGITKAILENHPYNLIANQIMSSVLYDSINENERRIYDQRCSELIPGWVSQGSKGKPADTETGSGVLIEKLEDSTIPNIMEKVGDNTAFLDTNSIPVDGIVGWLNSIDRYKQIHGLHPFEETAIQEQLDKEPLPQNGEISGIVGGQAAEEEDGADTENFLIHEEITEIAETEVSPEKEAGLLDQEFRDTDSFPEQTTEQTALEISDETAMSPVQESDQQVVPSTAEMPEVTLPGEETHPDELVSSEVLEAEDILPVSEELEPIQSESIDEEDRLISEESTEVLDEVGQNMENLPLGEEESVISGPETEFDDLEVPPENGFDIVSDLSIQTTDQAMEEENQAPAEPQAESQILQDGWIPLETPGKDAKIPVDEESAGAPFIPEVPSPLVQAEETPEPESGDINIQEKMTPDETIAAGDDEEEITKPTEITSSETTQDSDEEELVISTENQPEFVDKIVPGEKPEADAPDIDQAINSEKKHGFIEWLKSIKNSVQEEIKEPKLPVWMLAGKPSDRIKVPELKEILEQQTTPDGEIFPTTQTQETDTVPDLPEEEQAEKREVSIQDTTPASLEHREPVEESLIPIEVKKGEEGVVKIEEMEDVGEAIAQEEEIVEVVEAPVGKGDVIAEGIDAAAQEQHFEEVVGAAVEMEEIPVSLNEEEWEVGYPIEGEENETEPNDFGRPKFLVDIESAKQDLNHGNFDKAANKYKKIIKTSHNLNIVINSLEEAVVDYPREFKLFQTLGDAYARVGRLQDALDAYTKAEELLQ